MPSRTNRLAAESSPYLQQHAHNPVDWYPWSEAALERARRENKPILLSIGYSACHWCHVMERESFENEPIAELMNRHFVNIKVDREERPDLDAIYMNAVQMMTGQGGWPLTVFITPAGLPFYGGTYFPPADRYGRPGFPRVLEHIARTYAENPDAVRQATEQILEGFRQISSFAATPEAPGTDLLARGAERLLQTVDRERGGIGTAPKFPNVPVFELFLRLYHATRRNEFLDAVTLTLTRMAQGGIYDHLGGGFHRYSVDEHWLVPHFEKMLYDNTQLARLYLDAFSVTGDPLYRRIAAETLGYMSREMLSPTGGFYSTQDADSEGEEGKFFLWTKQEVEQLFASDPDVAEIACRTFDIDEVGNFAEPGHSSRKAILNVKLSIDQVAKLFRRDPGDVERIIERSRQTLFESREKRVKPARDEKVLTSWNALAISAFVRGANQLNEPRYLEIARRAAAFLHDHVTDSSGRPWRSWKDGKARHVAILDDHALLADALIDLFAATGDPIYLARARELGERMVREFADPTAGGFFLTAADAEQLVDRPKSVFDGSIPSGNAVATRVLLRLSWLTGEARSRELAEASLRLFATQMEKQPFGTATLLGVLDEYLRGPIEVLILGAAGDLQTHDLALAANRVYAPNKIVLVVDPNLSDQHLPEALRGKRQLEGRATAYVCRSFTCSPPVTEVAALEALLIQLIGDRD